MHEPSGATVDRSHYLRRVLVGFPFLLRVGTERMATNMVADFVVKRVLREQGQHLEDGTVGVALDPKQSKHVKRGLATADPILTSAGNQFPWPTTLNTMKQSVACIPTDVVGVTLAP
jgi:hypothetical protein